MKRAWFNFSSLADDNRIWSGIPRKSSLRMKAEGNGVGRVPVRGYVLLRVRARRILREVGLPQRGDCWTPSAGLFPAGPTVSRHREGARALKTEDPGHEQFRTSRGQGSAGRLLQLQHLVGFGSHFIKQLRVLIQFHTVGRDDVLQLRFPAGELLREAA